MKTIQTADEVFLIADPSNLYYISGIKNADAFILLEGENKYYYTDSRYMEDATSKLTDFTVRDVAVLHDVLRENAYASLGIEGNIPFEVTKRLKEDGISTFYTIDDRMQAARAIKTPEEIEFIRKAQEITDKTFADVLHIVKEGMTEQELAGTLESMLFVNGAEDLAFTSIVAFGESTSMPHAIRSEKKLEPGNIITMDFGAKYHNYCSDMTRTFFFGQPDPEQLKIYKTVLTAQEMALAVAYSGITAKECDSIARKFFAEYNLDRYFIHTLGHGVGIDIHEYPRLAQNCNAVMEDNMVVTIEPGLYFPKEFGVRIEDMIIFNKSGIINLTKSPKKVIII